MGNQNIDIGFDFMAKTFYTGASLQQERKHWDTEEAQPLPFKVYQNTDLYKLDQMPALTPGDARWSFHEFRQASSPVQPAPRRNRLDLESLSMLLYYTYGFSRHDEGSGVAWPFHRFIPSARCFFPTELYVWLPQTERIPAGIYHYDNLHHSLALLRQGEYRGLLAQSLDTDLDNCLCVLLLSALFWKNAFYYLNFSYRLSTQEAGLVTSNALIVAGTLGFSGHVHYQFLDQPLNRLLGFEPDEESLLSVVPLYRGNNQDKQSVRRLWARTTQQALCDSIEPLALRYIKTGSFDHKRCALLTQINRHSFLEDSAEIVTETPVPGASCLTTEERIAAPVPFAEEVDLAEALSLRSSGDVDFLPLGVPLTQGAFWEIVRYGLSVYSSDLQYPPSSPRLQLYIVIQHVEGMDKGIYRLCADCGMLHVIKRDDIAVPIQAIQTQRNITSTSANLICYLIGDYPAASSLFGNRAYRILHLEAGLIAQRICVMSASQGLVTRYSNSYDTAQCEALLNLTNASVTPIAELVIGYERPDTQAGRRYRFSLFR